MPIGDNDNELWDIYDRERQLKGYTRRRGDLLQPGEYHLVVHVCIFNSKGELLIQKRQSWKRGYPNMWDVSAGGSATTGDDSRRAAEREVGEELGLKIDLTDEMVRFTFNWAQGFDDYWLIKRDVDLSDLHLQYEEVSDAKWADRAEVARLVAAGEFVPYFFMDRLFDIYEGDGAIDDTWDRQV